MKYAPWELNATKIMVAIEWTCWVGMKMDRIWTDITDITFVFIFLSRFGFEYG